MISNPNFSLFPSKDLLMFGRSFIDITDARAKHIPVIIPYLNYAVSQCDNFQVALEFERADPFKGILSKIDEERVNAFMSFRTYCESTSTCRRDDIPTAAVMLLCVIRKHGWSIQTLGLKYKTKAITNIISEIKTKYSSELTLIEGDELLDELASAQIDFETLAHHIVETTSVNYEPTVNDTRPYLIAALKALFQVIGLQQVLSPNRALNDLINSLNGLTIVSLVSIKTKEIRAEGNEKLAENMIEFLAG